VAKEDLRSGIDLCENFFILKKSKFKRDETKVLWAQGHVKENSKAAKFVEGYVRALKNGEQSYASWEKFKEEMCARFLSTQEGSEALAKMQRLQYKGDISQYRLEMESWNRHAQLSGPGLRDIVKRGLSDEINFFHDQMDDTDDDGIFWKQVEKAGKKQEAITLRNKVWGERGGSSKKEKKKPKRESSSGDSSEVTKPKYEKTSRISKTPKDDKTTKKAVRTFKEAIKGIPDDILDKRRSDRVCRRCGKEGHAAVYCTCKAPVVAAVSKHHKNKPKVSVKTENTGSSDVSSKPTVALTSQPSAPKIWEIQDEDTDMVDWSISDEEEDF
jgi:hypothetical protein